MDEQQVTQVSAMVLKPKPFDGDPGSRLFRQFWNSGDSLETMPSVDQLNTPGICLGNWRVLCLVIVPWFCSD